jgi:hypothetical protein
MVRVIKRAPASMILEDDLVPERKVKVRVIDKYRVVDPVDAKRYIKGETLTVAGRLAVVRTLTERGGA